VQIFYCREIFCLAFFHFCEIMASVFQLWSADMKDVFNFRVDRPGRCARLAAAAATLHPQSARGRAFRAALDRETRNMLGHYRAEAARSADLAALAARALAVIAAAPVSDPMAADAIAERASAWATASAAGDAHAAQAPHARRLPRDGAA
jgi:hypothetical protein